MKKKLLLITLLAVAALALAACTPQTPAATATPVPPTEQPSQEPVQSTPEASPETAAAQAVAPEAGLELTLEELAKFNGKDGARAYVAVDGIIYDMTDSDMWKNGDHNGFEAGKDLTDAIKNQSPHGVGNLTRVPVVGRLVTE